MSEQRAVAPDPPEQSKAYQALSKTVEAAAGMVPFVGGALGVAVAHFFGAAYERRLDEWRTELTEAIQYLTEHDGVSVEDLADDDGFLDAVATATRIAGTTGSKEKRRYLRNALINVGSGTALGDKQAVYLRYVDELTPAHMQMLALLNDPPGYLEQAGIPWPNLMMGGLGAIVERGLPELYADEPLLHTVVADLDRYGLADNPGLNTIMSGEGIRAGRSTPKGREFVAFIRAPDEDKD